MYAVGSEHPLKEPCVAILAEIARGDLIAATDAEVVQEILHPYSALGQRGRVVEVARLFLTVVPDVLPVTKDDLLLISALGTLPGFPGHLADALHGRISSSPQSPRRDGRSEAPADLRERRKLSQREESTRRGTAARWGINR
jgi:hypothetical protein